MAMGSMTLACALLMAHAGAPETYYMNQGRFTIPIKIAADRRNEVRELLLYVSRDQGRTWTNEARATPDKDAFPFYATSDGHYWFKVAVIDRQNKQDPVDIYQAPEGQRIYVDTHKPEVRLVRAERRGDEVQVQWEVREEYPDLATFKVEYRSSDQPATWLPVAARAALQGAAAFRPQTASNVQVRVLLTDLAGNSGQAIGEVTGASTTAVAAAAITPAASTAPSGVPLEDPLPLPPANVPGTPIGTYQGTSAPTESVSRLPGRTNEDFVGKTSTPPVAPAPQPLPTSPPPAVANQGMQPIGGAPAPIALTSGQERVSTATLPPAAPTAHGGLPAVAIINKRQAKLDFSIGKYGPSGLGSVDVYVTADDGATWTLSPTDRSVMLPPAAELRSSGASANGSVSVELKQEGVVYGYYIVVKSRAGLGKEPPRTGTAPQIRLEMDITPPAAALYEPKADPGHRDTLQLAWEATDKNSTNTVTLEWAEQKDGKWNVIGANDLPNTGKYSWQVPSNVPPSVYLRLTARDTAGNVAVAQTPEPVLVDLSVPEVGGISLNKDR